MPPPATCWARNSVSTVTIMWLYVSSCLPLQSVKKSPFRQISSDSSRKWILGCLWLRSRITAHNKLSEAGQLLGLFQYIYLFALYQRSSSNLHYKLKSTNFQSDLRLDKTRFLVIYHREWPSLCSLLLLNGKERPVKTSCLVSLSTFSGLLWWPPKGLAALDKMFQ